MYYCKKDRASTLILGAFLAIVAAGCITVTTPEGTTTTKPDTEAIVSVLVHSLDVANQALQAYMAWAEEQNRLQDAEVQRNIDRQRQQIEMIVQMINALQPQTAQTTQ